MSKNRYGASVGLMRWYDRKKRQNPLAGLSFFQRQEPGRALIIASRHWPHSITWSWMLLLRYPDGKSGTHSRWGIHSYKHNSGGWFVVGPLWMYWQHEMPKFRSNAEYGDVLKICTPEQPQ